MRVTRYRPGDLISGGYDISITKGNMFKAVLGMKTALKVHIYPANEQIWPMPESGFSDNRRFRL